MDYSNSASSVIVYLKSKRFNCRLYTSMRFLDNIFNKNIASNIQVINFKPLILRGQFTFQKKGSVIHVVEYIN